MPVAEMSLTLARRRMRLCILPRRGIGTVDRSSEEGGSAAPRLWDGLRAITRKLLGSTRLFGFCSGAKISLHAIAIIAQRQITPPIIRLATYSRGEVSRATPVPFQTTVRHFVRRRGTPDESNVAVAVASPRQRRLLAQNCTRRPPWRFFFFFSSCLTALFFSFLYPTFGPTIAHLPSACYYVKHLREESPREMQCREYRGSAKKRKSDSPFYRRVTI